MTVKKTSHEILQKEQDLNDIIGIFNRTILKYKKRRLEIPYKYAITFIADLRQMKTTQVKEYLDILDVRGVIIIKKEHAKVKIIEYKPKKNSMFDIDKYFDKQAGK